VGAILKYGIRLFLDPLAYPSYQVEDPGGEDRAIIPNFSISIELLEDFRESLLVTKATDRCDRRREGPRQFGTWWVAYPSNTSVCLG
jgi:hypothetical protein